MARDKKRARLSEGGSSTSAAPKKTGALVNGSAGQENEDAAAWNGFCEEYHDIVEQLPLELKRSFLLVSELEHHMQASQTRLREALLQYIVQRRKFKVNPSLVEDKKSSPMIDDDPASLFSARDRRNTPPPPSPRTQILNLAAEIAKDSRVGIRTGEDKVQQANAMYETVDRHIRRLDSDLAKYEDSLVIGLRAGTLPSTEAPSLFAAAAYSNSSNSVGARGGQERPSAAITAAASLEDDHTRGVRVDPKAPPVPSSPVVESPPKKLTQKSRQKAVAHFVPAEESDSSETVGDNSEELYCHCKRVSFGDMIACDNEECPTEWYHYECVGLNAAPRGRWYCRDCVQAHGVQARQERR